MQAKRFCALFLSLCMVLTLIPGAALSGLAASAALGEDRITAHDSLMSYVDLSSTVYKTSGGTKSGTTDNEGPAKVFDGDLATKVGLFNAVGSEAVLTFRTSEAVTVTAYTFGTANDSPERDPRSWVFYGSTDGESYVELSRVDDYTMPSERKVYCDVDFPVETPAAYSYYKLVISAFRSSTDLYSQFAEFLISGYDTTDLLEVINAINLLADMKPGEEKNTAIARCGELYDALTVGKASVYNYEELETARMEAELGDAAYAVREAIDKIAAIGTVTYKDSCLEKIKAAETAYAAVPEAARSYVTNAAVLTAARTQYEDYITNGWVNVTDWGTAESWSTSPWLADASEEEIAATHAAVTDEIRYQYLTNKYDYDLLGDLKVSTWMGLPAVSSESAESSNLGNPWGHAGRYVSCISMPFTGMAFSNNGYFYVKFSYASAISSPFEYNGFKVLQSWNMVQFYPADTEEVKGGTVNMSAANRFPGSINSGDRAKSTFRYVYAAYNQEHKWEGKTFGYAWGDAVWNREETILVQDFDTDSDGHNYLVNTAARIAATDAKSEASIKENAAFVINGKILDVLYNKFPNLTRGQGDHAAQMSKVLDVLGAPTNNAVTDADGNVTQLFERSAITVFADGSVSFEDGNLTFAEITGDSIVASYVNGSEVALLLAEDADKSSVNVSVTLTDENAVMEPAAGTWDLSAPLEVKITAADGDYNTVTVTAYSAADMTDEDRAAITAAEDLAKAVPVPYYRSDREAAQKALDAFGALTAFQKTLYSAEAELAAIDVRMEELLDTPIRITTVGDSITEGVGSSNSADYSYPAQLQTILGDDYLVTNAGISGTTAINTQIAGSSYPYITSPGYSVGLNSNPDIVIMMLGTNDAQTNYWDLDDGIDNAKTYHDDYAALIEKYLAMDSKPVIYMCSMIVTSDTYCSGRETNNVNYLNPIVRQLVEEYDLEYIDMRSWSEYWLNDYKTYFADNYLHPNDYGYKCMAEKYADVISEYITEVGDPGATALLMDGVPVEGFSPEKTEYTLVCDAENSEVTMTAAESSTVSVEKDGDSYQITVVSKYQMNGVTYTVDLVSSADPMAEAYRVIALIDELNEASTAEEVAAVRAAYEALTAEQKAAVTNYSKLEEAEQNAVKPGDVDGDGAVTVSDVVELRKLIVAGTWTDREFAAGNLDNSDALLTVSDVVALRALIVQG